MHGEKTSTHELNFQYLRDRLRADAEWRASIPMMITLASTDLRAEPGEDTTAGEVMSGHETIPMRTMHLPAVRPDAQAVHAAQVTQKRKKARCRA